MPSGCRHSAPPIVGKLHHFRDMPIGLDFPPWPVHLMLRAMDLLGADLVAQRMRAVPGHHATPWGRTLGPQG